MKPVSVIPLQRQIRIYTDPSVFEKAQVTTEGIDEPYLFEQPTPQKKMPSFGHARESFPDNHEWLIRKILLTKLEDGRFTAAGMEKNSGKIVAIDSFRKCYPALHEDDLERIRSCVISQLDPADGTQILEYWNMLGKHDLNELNLIIFLKKMKMLHPLPAYVRGLKGSSRAMAFFLNLFRYFHENKDIKLEVLPADPPRNAICLRIPESGDFNLLRVIYRSSDFETETILRMLQDPGKTCSVLNVLAEHGIFSTYHFVKFSHALYPAALSGIETRNPTQVPEIRYIRGSLLRFRKTRVPDLSPPKYILAKFFSADIRPDFVFEDDDLELLLEGLQPELVYPRDREFPLCTRLNAPSWAGEVVPLNSASKIDEEGDFQQNCLRSIEKIQVRQLLRTSCPFFHTKERPRITVEVGKNGKIIQCFGYKNSYCDPEELDLRTEPEPEFIAPEPVYVNDIMENKSFKTIASGVRNRNEFLDTVSQLMRKDPAEIREFVDTCMQYLFTLQEEKFKAFIRLRKSISARHTLEVRTDFLKIRLTLSPKRTVEGIFGK